VAASVRAGRDRSLRRFERCPAEIDVESTMA